MFKSPIRKTCSLDDLRDLETLLAYAGGYPVEILTDSGRIGLFVPQEWVEKEGITTEDEMVFEVAKTICKPSVEEQNGSS